MCHFSDDVVTKNVVFGTFGKGNYQNAQIRFSSRAKQF